MAKGLIQNSNLCQFICAREIQAGKNDGSQYGPKMVSVPKRYRRVWWENIPKVAASLRRWLPKIEFEFFEA
jgi:hypothetical protein